jgi:hypothetical protein
MIHTEMCVKIFFIGTIVRRLSSAINRKLPQSVTWFTARSCSLTWTCTHQLLKGANGHLANTNAWLRLYIVLNRLQWWLVCFCFIFGRLCEWFPGVEKPSIPIALSLSYSVCAFFVCLLRCYSTAIGSLGFMVLVCQGKRLIDWTVQLIYFFMTFVINLLSHQFLFCSSALISFFQFNS